MRVITKDYVARHGIHPCYQAPRMWIFRYKDGSSFSYEGPWESAKQAASYNGRNFFHPSCTLLP